MKPDNDQSRDADKGRHGSNHDGHHDDHGHTVTIIVNTREKTWDKKEISFREVLALAFDPVPTGGNWSFTVAYRRGHGNKPEGSLTEGESVKVKQGMVFSASATDKS